LPLPVEQQSVVELLLVAEVSRLALADTVGEALEEASPRVVDARQLFPLSGPEHGDVPREQRGSRRGDPAAHRGRGGLVGSGYRGRRAGERRGHEHFLLFGQASSAQIAMTSLTPGMRWCTSTLGPSISIASTARQSSWIAKSSERSSVRSNG